MKHFTVSLVVIIMSSAALAVEARYRQGTILDVEQKLSTRVLYYIVNTPITEDHPYYDVSLQLKDTAYTARYIPRHKDDELPHEWKAGSTIEARIQGRHLFIKTPGRTEVQLIITKVKASSAEENLRLAPHSE